MSKRLAQVRTRPSSGPAFAPGSPRWPRALSLSAVVVAGAFTLALAVRPVGTVDLGYHLAYGQRFLDTGQIVTDDSFIYPPVSPADVRPRDMPPGSWFDAEGRYRFLNANWLTQAVLAALWRLGGWGAMNATVIALVAVILAFQAAALARLDGAATGEPGRQAESGPQAAPRARGELWPWLAGVWLACGVIGHERFMLRPELFAYACLAGQLWLLAGKTTWARVVAFVTVQLVAVNVHSYWLLGVALVGAFWAESAARWAWARLIDRRAPETSARRRLVRLTVALAAMAPTAIAHPAGPANATFPLRTLAYLKQFDVTGMTAERIAEQWHEDTLHPWATIGEFGSSLSARQWKFRSTRALGALLALEAAAGAVLLRRQYWGQVLLLAGLTAVAVSMRRNVVLIPFLCGPVVAAALAGWWRGARARPCAARPATRWTLILPALAATAMLAIGAWWLGTVTTGRFYASERRPWRFGVGPSRASLPLGACRWLDEHLPPGQRIFTDQPNSSSVLFFSEKVAGVPILTNTWATPSDRFEALVELGAARRGLELLDEWGLDVAVLRVWPATIAQAVDMLATSSPARGLPAERQWTAVYAQRDFLVFVRRSTATPDMLADEITPAKAGREFHKTWFHLGAFAGRLGARQLNAGAQQLNDALAHVATRQAEGADGLRAGIRTIRSGMLRMEEARDCLQRSLALQPDYTRAKTLLRQTDIDMANARQALERAETLLRQAERN